MLPIEFKLTALCMCAFLIIGQHAQAQASSAKIATEDAISEALIEVVQGQAEDWNRGDIPAFMEAYWKSERLTFCSGGKTTRGWQATLERYLQNYPDRKTMGQLTFSKLEVQTLGPQVALMLGRWNLDREQAVGGNFSLVWQLIDGKWRIVHDHTSSDPE